MVHPLKNILNRLRWHPDERAEDYVITYRHRGAPGDIKQISGSIIRKLGKSYFTVSEAETEETVIPFHRILEIRRLLDDKIIWQSRKARN